MLTWLRGLLKPRDPFTPLERAVLRGFTEALPAEARTLLDAQVAQVVLIQRLDGQEVNLYRKKGMDRSSSALFPNQQEELKLGQLRFWLEGVPSKFTVKFILIHGRLFSLLFNKGMDAFRTRDQIVVEKADFNAQSMVAASEERVPAPEIEADAFTLAFVSPWRPVSVAAPRNAQEREALIADCSVQLPADYVELMQHCNGLRCEAFAILGLDEIHEVACDNMLCVVLAQLADLGVIVARPAEASPALAFCSFAEGKSIPAGHSLQGAIREALGATITA